MTEATTAKPLFAYSQVAADREEALAAIRQFCAQHPYRSAQVEELELNENFYRRPLRPEDLTFLAFDQPVIDTTASHLSCLHAQRMLTSINELELAVIPDVRSEDAAARWRDHGAFYTELARSLGCRVRHYLEHFAFDYLATNEGGVGAVLGTDSTIEAWGELWQQQARGWSELLERLRRRSYVREGLRFALIQEACLLHTKRSAIAQARAAGYCDALAPGDVPRLEHALQTSGALEAIVRASGVRMRPHSYWQMYLSTSLARCNLLHALRRRPESAPAFCGAAFAEEVQWSVFANVLARFASEWVEATPLAPEPQRSEVELRGRLQRALVAIGERHGEAGLTQFQQGFDAARRLAQSARGNLNEQLRWLSAVEVYMQLARRISERIDREYPDIDRDTFVEPREMCSTMHVHDDHRLVMIESGDMVFWGNLGMKLKMTRGDMVLIPAGRLHGSTVESDECTYHQPIIPDSWVQPLIREASL